MGRGLLGVLLGILVSGVAQAEEGRPAIGFTQWEGCGTCSAIGKSLGGLQAKWEGLVALSITSQKQPAPVGRGRRRHKERHRIVFFLHGKKALTSWDIAFLTVDRQRSGVSIGLNGKPRWARWLAPVSARDRKYRARRMVRYSERLKSKLVGLGKTYTGDGPCGIPMVLSINPRVSSQVSIEVLELVAASYDPAVGKLPKSSAPALALRPIPVYSELPVPPKPAGPPVYGHRFGKGQLVKEGGGPGTEKAVEAALAWLAKHQHESGMWDSDGWLASCPKGGCKGPGHAKGEKEYDVGVTGLALLAFLAHGYTHDKGPYKEVVGKGLSWLRQQQTAEGAVGFSQRETIYNHAIATMVLCEAWGMTRDKTLRGPAERAARFCVLAQNPGRGWKYGIKPGRNDTSVTGWMVFALSAAKRAGCEVALKGWQVGAQRWIEQATRDDGSIGYMQPGGGSSFLRINQGKFAGVPAMNAVGVASLQLMGARKWAVQKSVKALSNSLPAWTKDSTRTCNFYYWYYGTHAMFELGGEPWTHWNKALKNALLPNQRTGGCEAGSWDPVGEWCIAGGRVYSTAINALTLQVYYRFERTPEGR